MFRKSEWRLSSEELHFVVRVSVSFILNTAILLKPYVKSPLSIPRLTYCTWVTCLTLDSNIPHQRTRSKSSTLRFRSANRVADTQSSSISPQYSVIPGTDKSWTQPDCLDYLNTHWQLGICVPLFLFTGPHSFYLRVGGQGVTDHRPSPICNRTEITGCNATFNTTTWMQFRRDHYVFEMLTQRV